MGGLRPVPMKCYVLYLKAHGLEHLRTKASHHHYGKKGLQRPVVIQGAEKEVPGLHIHTNARTLGHDSVYAYAWFEANC